jgi:hypothetical protein
MTTHAADDADGQVGTDTTTGRYDRLLLGDDEVVIYDRENYRAWIQSSTTIGPEDLR